MGHCRPGAIVGQEAIVGQGVIIGPWVSIGPGAVTRRPNATVIDLGFVDGHRRCLEIDPDGTAWISGGCKTLRIDDQIAAWDRRANRRGALAQAQYAKALLALHLGARSDA